MSGRCACGQGTPTYANINIKIRDAHDYAVPGVEDASVVRPAEASAVRHHGLGRRNLREVRSELVHHHLGLEIPDLKKFGTTVRITHDLTAKYSLVSSR